MIRKATNADAGAIATFLEAHIETSMFLLSNLEAHGAENTDHPHGTAYFLRETGEGITGVFGCTNGGFVIFQIPGFSATEAQTYAYLLRGYTLRGINGSAYQVETLLNALPLQKSDWQLNRKEPLYALDLKEIPAPAAELRQAQQQDQPLLECWFESYMVETGTQGADDPLTRAKAAIGSEHIRLLIRDGQPQGMTAFNAQAGSAVQIGGVFVPPKLRGQGLAGQMIAAHLSEARAQGKTKAVLFAASDDAARAYEKIGFQRIGSYGLALLHQPTKLDSPA
ncbi:MAG: GNAT family N-acetyltransferase [Pelagimonas sp.]|jgi:GNAT superfamily N-acetyltransferase|nr:GNAT family N-acetyltransferase [Pelagimonas sp.]